MGDEKNIKQNKIEGFNLSEIASVLAKNVSKEEMKKIDETIKNKILKSKPNTNKSFSNIKRS